MKQVNERLNKIWHTLEEIDYTEDKHFEPTLVNFCDELVIMKLESKYKDVNIKFTRKQMRILKKKLDKLKL